MVYAKIVSALRIKRLIPINARAGAPLSFLNRVQVELLTALVTKLIQPKK